MLIIAYRMILVALTVLAVVASIIAMSLLGTKSWTVVFMPWAYLAFLWLTALPSWREGPSVFLLVCQSTAFLRYVAFPALLALGGGYQGRSWIEPRQESYDLAALAMGLEALVVGLVIHVLERRYHRRRKLMPENEARPVPRWYFICLLILGAALVALEPMSLMFINVGIPRTITDDVDIPALAALAAMTVISLKIFLFLRIASAAKDNIRSPRLAPWLASGACLVNAGIFFGTNRMAVVLAAAASFYVLYQMFGRRIATPLVGVLVCVLLLFAAITEERQYVQTSENPIVNLADNIQSYVGGNYNVAIGLEVAEFFPDATRPEVFLFDILRPTIGFNLIVQNWDMLYSNVYFNMRIFTHVDRRSQIMPMIAQAALFVPLVLAPLLPALVVTLAYLFLDAAMRTTSLELRYAFIIMAMRIGFFWGQNTMNMMNYLSLNVIIPLIMITGFWVLQRPNRRNNHRIVAST